MKGGKGRNEMHLNESTMINILNEHFKYSSDQVVKSVSFSSDHVSRIFIVVFDDKTGEQ